MRHRFSNLVVACVLAFFSGDVVAEIDQLAMFAMERPVFVWDSGTEPDVADPEDTFLLWCVDCDPLALEISYDQAVRLRTFWRQQELDHIQQVLGAADLTPSDLGGSIVRGRRGAEGSPLFILFPTPHPGNVSMGYGAVSDASARLHASNALDVLRVADRARRLSQTVTNVSETHHILSGDALNEMRSRYAGRHRDDQASDWQHALTAAVEDALDASQFLRAVWQDDATLTSAPIEPIESYLESVILNIVLATRFWNGIHAEATLYESFPEYVLGQKYHGSILHRFSRNPDLQDALRARWDIYRRYSRLTEEELHEEVDRVCRRRSLTMASELRSLVGTERSVFVLVTFGPMHLSGLLLDLEAREASYLVVTP